MLCFNEINHNFKEGEVCVVNSLPLKRRKQSAECNIMAYLSYSEGISLAFLPKRAMYYLEEIFQKGV